MLLPLLNVWQQKHTLPHAQGVRVFSRKHVVWSLSCRSLSHRFPHPRHYKGVSFRPFATKATVLLGSPHSPWATQASHPHVHTSPAFTGRYVMKRAGKRVRLVGAGVAGMRGGDPWVARDLFPRRFMPAIMGDASVPSPHRTSPAPTNVTIRPKKPTVESTSPAPTGTFMVISRYALCYATASPKASRQSWVWGRDKSGPYVQVGPSARAHRAQSVARGVSLRGARAGRASG